MTTTPVDTVFHLPESDPAYAERTLRNARNLLADETVTGDVALVCNGGGVDHVLPDTRVSEAVTAAIDAGVTVLACRNSLDGHASDAADLLDGVAVVPTAMGELARRQAAGAAYVRP